MTRDQLNITYPNALIWRYSEQDDTTYTLTCYREALFVRRAENLPPSEGVIGTGPPWMLNIVNIGFVGGHGSDAVDPPPKRMLWFATDADLNLLTFVEP